MCLTLISSLLCGLCIRFAASYLLTILQPGIVILEGYVGWEAKLLRHRGFGVCFAAQSFFYFYFFRYGAITTGIVV